MKYIDSEKLIAEIERRIEETRSMKPSFDQFWAGQISAFEGVRTIITSLQQEQPKSKIVKVKCYFPFDDTWEKDKIYTCEVWHHGDLNRDFWDVYYDYGKDARYVQFSSIQRLNEEFAIVNHEQDHLADTSKKEQPKVDLDKEFNDFLGNMEGMPRMWHSDEQIEWGKHIARHFYGLRNRALEEAARHVYESWMGGTTDDVRRDMVELGNVLNARKK